MKFNKKLGLIFASTVMVLSFGNGLINSVNTTTVHADKEDDYFNQITDNSFTDIRWQKIDDIKSGIQELRFYPYLYDNLVEDNSNNPYFNSAQLKPFAKKMAQERNKRIDNNRKRLIKNYLRSKPRLHTNRVPKFELNRINHRVRINEHDYEVLTTIKRDPEEAINIPTDYKGAYTRHKSEFKEAQNIVKHMNKFHQLVVEADLDPYDDYKTAIARAEKLNHQTHGTYEREVLYEHGTNAPSTNKKEVIQTYNNLPINHKSVRRHRINRHSKRITRTKLISIRKRISRKIKRTHSKRNLHSLRRQLRNVNHKLK